MNNINETLEQRGNRYGTIKKNSELTQTLLKITTMYDVDSQLSDVHKECLHMIFHKIARMVVGDCWYADNPHDIAGYAKLLEDFISENSPEHKD